MEDAKEVCVAVPVPAGRDRRGEAVYSSSSASSSSDVGPVPASVVLELNVFAPPLLVPRVLAAGVRVRLELALAVSTALVLQGSCFPPLSFRLLIFKHLLEKRKAKDRFRSDSIALFNSRG